MNTDRFKAKALTKGDNPEWVEGYYRPPSHWVFTYGYIENRGGLQKIDVDTLCQCTGLKDKEGNLIYEGDELECNFRHGVDKVGFVDAALSLHTGFVLRFPDEGGTHTYYVHMGGSNVLSITLTGKNIHNPNQ